MSITISGTGLVSANGGRGTIARRGASGGGSGGGITLFAPTVTNDGVVRADGGNGGVGGCCGNGGGGGGGRILVAGVSAGGGAYSAAAGSAGTPGFGGEDGADGVVTFDPAAFTRCGTVIPNEGGEAPIEENGKTVAVVIVPDDAFDEDVIVEFEFVDGPCHDFLISQYGRCLSAEFTTLDDQPAILNPGVELTYAMCLPIPLVVAGLDPLIIYEFDNSTSNVIPHKDFFVELNCSGFDVVVAQPGNGLMRFARGLVDRVTQFFAPEPLVAAPVVFRGNTGRGWTGLASLFVWARPIDIKPGSDPNSINCTNDKEVISVAVLTTIDEFNQVTFDATTIDENTVRFGPTAGGPGLDSEAEETHRNKKTGKARRHEQDVDDDGRTDMVFHFRFGDTGLTCDDTFAKLGGFTLPDENGDRDQIESADFVRMVGGN